MHRGACVEDGRMAGLEDGWINKRRHIPGLGGLKDRSRMLQTDTRAEVT